MAKTKFNQLTRAQHKRYGTFIKLFRDGFLHLHIILANTYPKNHPLSKASDKILSGLETLKCQLDDEVCSAQPGWPENIECYYGGRSWQHKEDAIFEAVETLEFPERKPFDLERILDRTNPRLSDSECLEIHQIQQQIKAILNRSGEEKYFEYRVHSILQQSKTAQKDGY